MFINSTIKQKCYNGITENKMWGGPRVRTDYFNSFQLFYPRVVYFSPQGAHTVKRNSAINRQKDASIKKTIIIIF